jgi:hypothetical protein
MANLSVLWTKGCKTPEEKGALEALIRNSGPSFRPLIGIIQEELRQMDIGERSVGDFSEANWAYKQAFRNGQKASLTKILSLIDIV